MSFRFRLLLLLIVAGLAGCSAPREHPPIDPQGVTDRIRPSFVTPYLRSTASIDQLQDAAAQQAEIFRNYRVQYGDSFTVVVLNEPDWTTDVTVLQDGRIHFGFLGQSHHVLGKTFDEVIETLLYGDPPQRPCPNCGYYYDQHATVCPVCRSSPWNIELTARLLMRPPILENIGRLGGILGPHARPIRPVTGHAGLFAVLCARGVLVVRQDSPRVSVVQATIALGQLRLLSSLVESEELPESLPVRLGDDWLTADLTTGKLEPMVDDQPAPTDELIGFEPAATGSGLNGWFRSPRVKLENVRLAPTSYTVKVVGAVNEPGRVSMLSGYRLWDAINDAGGPVTRQSQDTTRINQAPEVPTVDWERALLLREARYLPADSYPLDLRPDEPVRVDVDFERLARGDARQNIPLFPGDVVFIPQYAPDITRVSIVGQTGSNLYYFRDHIDLVGALATAGWIKEPSAKYSGIYLVRNSVGPPENRRVYLIDAIAVVKGRLANVMLEDGDLIYVDTDTLTDVGIFLNKIAPILGLPGLVRAQVRSVDDLITGNVLND